MLTEANIGNAISQAVASKLDASFVEKEVHRRVEKLVVEAVDSALRSYSDTGKLIEKAVADALRVDRLDLPSYGSVVSAILKVQIEAKVADLVAGKLAADMDELLSLAPKEIKLSQIADDMRAGHDEGEYGEIITVIVQTSEYGSRWIYLDEEKHIEDSSKYECKHSLLLNSDGTIGSATVDKRNLKDTQHIGRSYGLAQKLRAYVACGTVLIVDEDNVVTSVGDY
jgi:hypothetical protein